MSESEIEVEPGGVGVVPAAADDWTEPILAAHAVEEPAVEEQPEAPAWAGPPREEWEQSQEALGYFASLVEEAEQAGQEESAAAQREAEIEEYLGDPEEPGYELRLAELERAQLKDYIDERLAPVDEFATEQRFTEAGAEADRLLDETFAPLNLELTDEMRAGLREFASRELEQYQEFLISQGVPAEVAYGPKPAREVLQALGPHFAPTIEAARRPPGGLLDVARRHGQGGDELDVARRHTAGLPASPAPPRKAVVQQVFGQGPFNGSWVRPKERI